MFLHWKVSLKVTLKNIWICEHCNTSCNVIFNFMPDFSIPLPRVLWNRVLMSDRQSFLSLSSDRVLHSTATKAGIAGFPSLIAMHISIIFIGTGEFPLFSNYSASIDICFCCFRDINQWRPEQMDSQQAWCCCCGNRVRGW